MYYKLNQPIALHWQPNPIVTTLHLQCSVNQDVKKILLCSENFSGPSSQSAHEIKSEELVELTTVLQTGKSQCVDRHDICISRHTNEGI